MTTSPGIIALLIALFPLSAQSSPEHAGNFQPQRSVVVGADRLLSDYTSLIKGKRLALVTNHSGRLSDGTHLADALFRSRDAQLVVLFGMEYNIRTNDYSLVPDEEKSIDRETGLTKYSLYGKVHKPTPEMLRGVDAVILDIQEVGTRFYEHVNILGFVMEAAAENGLEVIVLDRPNPITGLTQDGFLPDDSLLYRFGSYAKIPVLHGLTMGEVAQFYNGERMLRGGVTAKLQVVPMQGWKRSMWFDETRLEWRKPSPNLQTLNSVLAYAGTCLFEGINISEGRGTERPFEYIGAPWIDNNAAALLLKGLDLKGVTFEPTEFTPARRPHLSRNPELGGELCRGIFVHVTDRNAFQPYRAGIALVWAFHKLHPEKLVWNEAVIERLTGTSGFVRMINDGMHPAAIFATWESDVRRFHDRSKKYHLYPD